MPSPSRAIAAAYTYPATLKKSSTSSSSAASSNAVFDCITAPATAISAARTSWPGAHLSSSIASAVIGQS
ncbi:hypothetical protein ACIBHX_01705 [Nonomuraea sp. NPDC050536]|uniref:hypothetical protein n=1 Tax=Nonomuraea sp. NPDC050536 TaxID=3364366 RepID=UPI0037C5FB07